MRTIAGDYANDRVTEVGMHAFAFCTQLVKLDFSAVTSIAANAFSNCNALETLILRTNTVCALTTVNAFGATRIQSGTGYIYVPATRLAEYQVATNWSTYAAQFRSIEGYPEICGGDA
jgi:hypothetical protein